jgi:hypothetical protein
VGTPAAGQLSAATLCAAAGRLGFRPEDLTDLRSAATARLSDPAARAEVAACAERVRAGIGVLDLSGPSPWRDLSDPRDGIPAVLALLACVDDVVAYQRLRGIEAGDAWRACSDLGQQVWVHRLTYGRFGLHTYEWLRVVWGGGFAWLGRLEFNLQWLHDRWVIGTHIPRRGAARNDVGSSSGALAPETVDEAFVRAVHFYARHFHDHPTSEFWCSSWLLDPELAAALPGSNIAAFSRRWRLDDVVEPGDEDAVFFTFTRRGPVDLASLPRQTRLQRVVVDRLASGGHWSVRRGLIAQPGSANK